MMTFTAREMIAEQITIAHREGLRAGYQQAMTEAINFLQARIEEQDEEGWSGQRRGGDDDF